jgi:4-amino-4-deoxy-L-arabinose transferase-like glycosyltransferase
MKSLTRNLPCYAIIGFYLICILAVDPRGEFPLNDDWSYIRSALAFGTDKGVKVDEWSAPSLIGQAFYGGLLTKLFSPNILVLRLSTLFLSCCTALLLWGILRRIGIRRKIASIILLAWVFNPLQFNLAFTFMTEIPFLFFITLSIYLYLLYLDTGSSWLLALSAAAMGYTYLIRQTALFFILGLILSLFTDARKSRHKRAVHIVLAATITGIFILSYYLWITSNGGATAAVHRKFELLNYLTARQIIGNSYGMLFYLAFMLIPVWTLLFPSLLPMTKNLSKKIKIIIPSAWGAIVIFGIWWFNSQYLHSVYLPSTAYHARMPYLLNVLYDTGLGPITLDPEYFGPSPIPTYPHLWFVITGIVAAGAVFCGTLLTFGLLQLRRLSLFKEQKPFFAFTGFAFALTTAFEIVFSHLQEGGLFDRHILTTALTFCLLLVLICFDFVKNNGNRERFKIFPAGLTIVVLATFCVAATHDYMEWNRIRWNMGRDLLLQKVDPLTIAGGFEFNAWNNYDTFVARGNIAGVHHWWYDRRDYLISMSPQEGYEIIQSAAYLSWVHRCPISLYVLHKSAGNR